MIAPVVRQRFDFSFVRLIEKIYQILNSEVNQKCGTRRSFQLTFVLGVWNCDKNSLSCLIYNAPFFESSLEVNERKTTDWRANLCRLLLLYYCYNPCCNLSVSEFDILSRNWSICTTVTKLFLSVSCGLRSFFIGSLTVEWLSCNLRKNLMIEMFRIWQRSGRKLEG